MKAGGLREARGLRERWYRAPTASGLASDSQVDMEASTIRGFSVMEIGEARGHGEEADEATIESIVALGNSKKNGVKMRFGHPGMSDDAIGSFAGDAKNFRLDGAGPGLRAVADIEFSDSAKADPSNMVERIMLRARDQPHAFGNSVVIKRDLEFRFEDDGKTRLKDSDDVDLPPLIRPLELMASDLVDSPAATTALFSSSEFSGSNVELSAGATEVLDALMERADAEEHICMFFDKFALSRPDAAARIRTAIERPQNRPIEVEMDPTKGENAPEDETSMLDRIRLMLRLTTKQKRPGNESDNVFDAATPWPSEAVTAGEAASPATPDTVVLGEMQAEITALRKSIEEDKIRVSAEALMGKTQGFDRRVNSIVAFGRLTSSGADALKSRGKQLILAGADPDELIKPFEEGPNVRDDAILRSPVTFSVPVPGHDDIPVDMLSFGSRQNPNGEFGPVIGTQEASDITLKLRGKKGKDAIEELRRQVVEGEGY